MQSVIFSVSQQHVVRVSRTHWQNLRMLCQSMFIIAMRISIFQSLLFENEAYNIFLAFCYPCSWKFLSFSHDLTLPIVGSTFQLTGRHDLIGSSRPDRIVTIRRDICSFSGSSTSGSRAYFLFKLHDPTSGESGRQQQLTTRLSSCILDMCASTSLLLTAGRSKELSTSFPAVEQESHA